MCPTNPREEASGLDPEAVHAAAAYADRYDLSMAFLGDASSAASYYGVVHDEWEGHYDAPKRAVFFVDGDWRVRFAWSTDDAFEPSTPSPVELVWPTVRERFPDANSPPSVQYDRI